MRSRRTAFARCCDDGRPALDDDPADARRAAIGHRNYLFAGSDTGRHRAAALYSLIESTTLNGLNPQLPIADLLARIGDHPARRIGDLLPGTASPLRPHAPLNPASSPSGYGGPATMPAMASYRPAGEFGP